MSDEEPPEVIQMTFPVDLAFKPTAPVAAPEIAQPLAFCIPIGTPARECTSCKARIYWVLSGKMRWMPVDPTGTSHFATCPNADAHRRAR